MSDPKVKVRLKHPDYSKMSDRWQMCRDAAEGEAAVHAQSTLYLPKLVDEEEDAYALRLKMTPFFNATWRTIMGMQGMIFRKDPTKNLPTQLDELFEDIDLAGTTLDALAREVTEEALTVGRVGLLVDYPVTAPGLTVADVKSQGLHTMISLYKAEAIYNWKMQKIGGIKRLVQVRLQEEAVINENEFENECQTQYRVLDLFEGKYRQRVYIVNEQGEEVQLGEDIFPTMGSQYLPFIPFVFIGVDCTDPDIDAPPLIDLVTTNFHHYMQATSYERGCFFSGLPTMFISGMEKADGEISVGGSIANALSNPNAKAYFVEVMSKFEALRTNLEDKKREMAVLGARMLESTKAGVEAAETVARRQTGEESILSSMSRTISQGLEQALNWFILWEGYSGNCKYELNRDFLPMSMDSGTLAALVTAWQNGGISSQVLFENLQKGEIIAPEVTFEEEEGRKLLAGPGVILDEPVV
jgi:hypothetical protein